MHLHFHRMSSNLTHLGFKTESSRVAVCAWAPDTPKLINLLTIGFVKAVMSAKKSSSNVRLLLHLILFSHSSFSKTLITDSITFEECQSPCTVHLLLHLILFHCSHTSLSVCSQLRSLLLAHCTIRMALTFSVESGVLVLVHLLPLPWIATNLMGESWRLLPSDPFLGILLYLTIFDYWPIFQASILLLSRFQIYCALDLT